MFVVSHLGSTGRRTPWKGRGKQNAGRSKNRSWFRNMITPHPPLVYGDAKEYEEDKHGATASVPKSATEGVSFAALLIERPFASAVLAAIITSFLLSWIPSQVTPIVLPVCSTPFISPMIPFCHLDIVKQQISGSGQGVLRADYPSLVSLQTRAFNQLLNGHAENKGLALEVRKVEMASNDLITLVRASDLSGGDQMAERLSQFVEDVRGAGRSLRLLEAKIQGAADS